VRPLSLPPRAGAELRGNASRTPPPEGRYQEAGFRVLPCGRAAERTFSRRNRWHRLVSDLEQRLDVSKVFNRDRHRYARRIVT
jgi:hypothetical protein